jgi:diguanylate cyclase (GGDEF)-like protein
MAGQVREKIAAGVRALRSERISALLGRPLRSLPARITLSVFGAALVTSLTVAWTSTHSIESFLRAKIDRKFPELLRGARDRLDTWYGQRELDLQTFARSATVAEGVERLAGGGRGAVQAREELKKYLDYVLEGFPQYASLCLLDREGRILLQAGAPLALSRAERERLGATVESAVSDVELEGTGRRQLVSAVVRNARGARVATLHAALRLSSVEEALRSDELGETGAVFVVAPSGEVLLQSPGTPARRGRGLGAVGLAADGAVHVYQRGDGRRAIASAARVPRFGWNVVVEEEYDQAFAPVGNLIREVMAVNLGIVLIFGVIAFTLARSIVRPVNTLSQAARRIAAGETDVVIDDSLWQDELGVLTHAFNEMASRLRQNQLDLETQRVAIEDANDRLLAQNRELQRLNEVFQQLSITDDLTHLHNHRFFQERLPLEIKRSLRTHSPLSLVLIDLDDFKALNDCYGHAVGDAVLRRVAETMHRCVRDSDLLARYGGEEFALLACDTDLEGAVALAEKIRLAIAGSSFALVDLDGPKEIRITASFGVAQYRGNERALFNEADRALYRAKAMGKDCVARADPKPGRSRRRSS